MKRYWGYLRLIKARESLLTRGWLSHTGELQLCHLIINGFNICTEGYLCYSGKTIHFKNQSFNSNFKSCIINDFKTCHLPGIDKKCVHHNANFADQCNDINIYT